MKKIILSLLTIALLNGQGTNYFVDNFLKFSTAYGSFSLSSPYQNDQSFEFSNGQVSDDTEEFEFNYTYTFGIRKIARFGYETKAKKFYDGSEKAGNESVTIGAVPGWEYLIKHSQVRSFGKTYNDSEYWLRYVAEKYVLKGQYSNFGLEGLKFSQLDARYRKSVGNFSFTVGTAFRGRPIVIEPNIDWQEEFGDAWWELAYEFGYIDEWYWIDNYSGDYYWYDSNGNLISETDAFFYESYFDGIINNYYTSQIIDLGWQWETSLALGVEYYTYTDKWWLHVWGTILPLHTKVTSDVQVTEGIDHDIGLIFGWKITPHIGIFTEGRHLSYFTTDRGNDTHYELKAGLNYTFF